MIPLEETLRMRELYPSAKNRFPARSRATPADAYSQALMAGPPSPEKPKPPAPATVVMIPLEETLRMRGLSAMKRFPALSTATPDGLSRALIAGPPSPEKP